jgi:hypothetical protein
LPGTPAAFSASTMDWARDRPRVNADDWASGSLEVESPYPMTEIVPLPRFAAKALTSSVAGCDRLEARSRNTIVADVPAAGAGIGAGTTCTAGAAGAVAGRGGGPSGNAGCGPVGGALAAAVAAGPAGGVPAVGDGEADWPEEVWAGLAGPDAPWDDAVCPGVGVAGPDVAWAGPVWPGVAVWLGVAVWPGVAVCAGAAWPGVAVWLGVAVWPGVAVCAGAAWPGAASVVGGASSGVLCTDLRGAGDSGVGGAVTAGMEALATGAPVELDPTCGALPGGGGGGAVPTPNRPGEELGEEGSANGADCAACCALVRSATSESVSFFNAS